MSDNRYRNEYNRTAYKTYTLRLRYDDDADLIDYLDGRMAEGSFTEVLRKMLRRSLISAARRRANEAVRDNRHERQADQDAG